MEEIASAELFQHQMRHWNISECFVPSVSLENGDEDESDGEGNLGTEDLDDQDLEDGELALDHAGVKSSLSAAPSIPDEASEVDANSVIDHYEPLKVEIDESTKQKSLKKVNSVSNLKNGTDSSVRRSTSARSNQAPPSPKPYLRSSSLGASRRLGSATESNIKIGDGIAKLGLPIISAAPIIKRRSLISGQDRRVLVTRRCEPITGHGSVELITRRSSVEPGTIGQRIPFRTTDSTRKSLSGMMNPVQKPRSHSLSGVTSVSRSLDLLSLSDHVNNCAASVPALKASGRRVSNSASSSVLNSAAPMAATSARQSSSTPVLENLSSRHSLTGQKSAAESGRPLPENSISARSQTGSIAIPKGNSDSSPSSRGSIQRFLATTVSNKEALKKKLASSASLGPRRSSTFAEPVGAIPRRSTSPSRFKPSERSTTVSTQNKGFSPLEQVPSSCATFKRAPAENVEIRGTSNGKSPTSNQNFKPSPSRAIPNNTGNGGSKEKSSPAQGSDRGPCIFTRRKSLTLDTRESRLVSLPPVDLKAGDDVRIDLRGRKVRTLDGNLVTLTSKMEFVYLRDNKLSTLSGIEILRRVKVLDLSFNEFKGSGFEPLTHCKALQQLYLAGNQITSLTDLPLLPNLEFLSVAQNKIKSLDMASQPRLQVLAASKNKISTLKDFPNLPSLEHLRLEENPILESFHVEAQSILLVGPSLKKFNDRDLSLEELELAQMYPPSTALCIREGWELCAPEEATESTLQFLRSQWRESIPLGYMVKKAWVGRPQEEDPCSCEFGFEKLEDIYEEADLVLKYQWFVGDKTPINFVPISGADALSYWPKHEDVGKCLKVDCSILIREKQYGPVFAISAPVAAGSKCPKVLGLEVDGEFKEGAIVKGFPVVAWCGGTPGKSISSWLRRKDQSSPLAITGAEEREYRLQLDDVGFSLIYVYTPVTEEGVKGEPHYASTPVVQASPPSVSSVRIIGDAVHGNIIQGAGKYFGGKEGASKFEWLRENLDSGEFKLVSRGNSDYALTDADVGRRIMFMYTPVNLKGRVGDPLTATSATVLLAPPSIEELRIVGDLKEGSKVAVSALFTGGTEGASQVQWFKKATPFLPTDDLQVEPLSSLKVAKAFRIPLGAVGHYLLAKYTPVRSDNEVGEPVYAISETVVEMLPPRLTFLNLVGEFVEGETLTAQYGYVGGYEGVSLYSWYLHESEDDPGAPVVEAEGQLQYRISRQAVNKLISFRCRPVRDDGISGDLQIAFGTEKIHAGSPKLPSLHILGEPMEGHELRVGKEYWGGDEGICKVQWFVTRQDGTQREIKGAVHDAYTIQSEDIDGLLCVSCEPVRSDGVTGQVVVSSSVGPVVRAPPSCTSLELCGVPVEGGSLSFKAAYKGGEKGDCFQEWVRHNVDGSQVTLSTSDILDLTSEDVGSRIELVFTPVRKDGSGGDSRSALSSVIVDGEPEGTDLVISQCFQDVEVIPRKVYFGGKEGKSEYTWYRTPHRPKDGQLPEDAKRLHSETELYTPHLDDVGSYLVLHWVPVRRDGKRGTPVIGYSNLPVAPALPVVSKVNVQERLPGAYVGEGEYYGGLEGESRFCWYRQTTAGLRTVIAGAVSKSYVVGVDDYTCSVVFGYTPVRSDGVVGELVLSDPSPLLYPEVPRIHKLVLKGQPVEGETLTALEIIPRGDAQQRSWEKYKKDVQYQWSRSLQPVTHQDHFETLAAQRTCSYKVRLEDQGYTLRCEAITSDVFGRSAEPAYVVTSAVTPGFPKVENLDIEGRGYHTSLFAVRGIYSGGKEGKSRLQWFRAIAGSPDLIPMSGEVGRMYEANVDDVGYRLVAVYTPVRDDGTEGGPVSVSTDPIIVNPEVAKEVKHKLELAAVKFEVLKNRDRSPIKSSPRSPQQQSLERRVLDVNRKRVKVVKPGSKTHFASTEIRGTYAPPFHVEVFRNDQHRLKIVIDTDNEVNLMVQSRHIRDIIVLVIRGFSHRFNTTPLNLLLKM